jgi:hypothetical protein
MHRTILSLLKPGGRGAGWFSRRLQLAPEDIENVRVGKCLRQFKQTRVQIGAVERTPKPANEASGVVQILRPFENQLHPDQVFGADDIYGSPAEFERPASANYIPLGWERCEDDVQFDSNR